MLEAVIPFRASRAMSLVENFQPSAGGPVDPDLSFAAHESAPASPGPQASFAVRVIIVAFVLGYMLGALWLLLDAWVFASMRLRWLLGMQSDAVLPPVFLSAFHAMLGAVLGAGALGIVSFHHYASIKGDFQARHVWGYFVAPVLASVLGLVVFALLQSGLLVFAGGGAADKADDLARLGYLAVGFLAGFGWYEATQSIQRLVKRFFSSDGAAEKEPRPPAA